MKLTNLGIKDLITPEAKLTFLVGAGCSIDHPSCQPAGRKMMDALIDYTCTKSEIDKIKKLKELRFEQLIEILSEYLDPELNIIDFYGLCDTPNLQHFFLAEMMKQGQFVLTTNFDFLIEYALQQSGVSKEVIVPIITREDFQIYNDPNEVFKQGKKALYKIHGSTKNIITGDPTRNSLIATIQAFGSNKEGENVFQLENFKQPAFINLTKGRSLVVLGYSGSDDFDIVPTLKVLKHIQDIIWINYVYNDGGKEKIYEIEMKDINDNENLTKVDQILVDIKQMNYAKRILRVDVNTTRLIRELIPAHPKISSEPFSIDINQWLVKNIKAPDKFMKLFIPLRIFEDFNLYEDMKPISTNLVNIAKKVKDHSWIALALTTIGSIYKVGGNYSESLKRYEEALKIYERLEILSGKATCLLNIGDFYHAQGNYPEALKRCEESLKIYEQLGDLSRKATCLNNIGTIYNAQGNYNKALKRYEEALNISEQLGDLSGRATGLNKIGRVYRNQGNYPEALKRYKQAVQISEQLGDLNGEATALTNIGSVYQDQGNYSEALEQYEEALHIEERIGDYFGIISSASNIGAILQAQGNYSEALHQFKGILPIMERLGQLKEKAIILNNIGTIYDKLDDYSKALKQYEEALQIFRQLGNFDMEVKTLINISGIYYALRNYSEALKRLKQALQIAHRLRDLNGEARLLHNIGVTSIAQGDYSEALTYFKKSLDIREQLKELSNIAISLEWIGRTYAKLNDTSKALQNLEHALQIYEHLGLENKKNKVLQSISDLKS